MASSSAPPIATGPNRSTAFWRNGTLFLIGFTVWGCLGDHLFHVRTGTLIDHWMPMDRRAIDRDRGLSVTFWLPALIVVLAVGAIGGHRWVMNRAGVVIDRSRQN